MLVGAETEWAVGHDHAEFAKLGHKHYRQDWRGLESPRHLQIFNPRSLLRLTQESSFDRCRVHTTNRSAWYVFRMSAALGKAREQSLSHATSLR